MCIYIYTHTQPHTHIQTYIYVDVDRSHYGLCECSDHPVVALFACYKTARLYAICSQVATAATCRTQGKPVAIQFQVVERFLQDLPSKKLGAGRVDRQQ